MNHSTIVAAIVWGACFCAPTTGTIINVPADWPTIQSAINNSQNGDEIVIAAGTHTGSFDTFGNSLTIRSASGDPASVILVGNDAWTVFVASFETVTIRDLTIRNPGARGLFVHNDSTVNLDNCRLELMNGPNTTEGAIVHLRGGSSLNATNCIFRDSTNVGSGGAIGITDGAVASIVGCTFQNLTTTSNSGGALHVKSSATLSTLAACMFLNSSASRNGGALRVDADGVMSSVSSCEFTNAVAQGAFSEGYGGAIDYRAAGPMTLNQCTFEFNSAARSGGGVYASGPLTLIDCQFKSNAVTGADDDGGAVYAVGALTLIDCDFRENSVLADGGAVYCLSSYQISGSAFLCNTAAAAGALYVGDVAAPETITNCFFALNDADGGGAIFSNNATGGPGVSDTTFCGNHIGQIKGGWINQGGNLISTFCLANPPITCDTGWPFQSQLCPGDVVASGTVDVLDLVALIVAWGTTDLFADLNRNGTVDVGDLAILIVNWGECQ
jgi:hypothetical protein